MRASLRENLFSQSSHWYPEVTLVLWTASTCRRMSNILVKTEEEEGRERDMKRSANERRRRREPEASENESEKSREMKKTYPWGISLSRWDERSHTSCSSTTRPTTHQRLLPFQTCYPTLHPSTQDPTPTLPPMCSCSRPVATWVSTPKGDR